MKPHASLDHLASAREQLENLLRRVVKAPNPYLRSQALIEISRTLVHPRDLLAVGVLSDHDPLLQQAIIVADAWEAVTNGMPEAALLEELDRIPPDSPLRPWREAVLAIYFFYEDLEEASRHHLSLIPSDTPLFHLKTALETLWSGRDGSGSLKALTQKVLKVDSRAQEAWQMLIDAWDTGLEDAFLSAWDRLANLLQGNETLEALTVGLWGELAWQDFDDRTFLELTGRHFGEPTAYRLAALGSFAWDPEGALLWWGQFLITSVREKVLPDTALTVALQIFQDWIEAVADFQAEQGRIEGWEKDWRYLAQAWNSETQHAPWPEVWTQALRPEKPAPRPKPRVNADQLELFSLLEPEGTS
ncbi:MAG: hypothetical protein HKM05_12360 [Spirochaetales bacterium]|nr:hypothetical protein [Spirochaetales bacterium]